MIDAATIDYDRVHSSTVTEDGERIVLTFDTQQGATNISLPASEVPRLIVAVSNAAGMAKAAQAGKEISPVFPVRSLGFRDNEESNEVLLMVELNGGSELTFRTDRQTATRFIVDCAQALGLMPGQTSPRSTQ